MINEYALSHDVEEEEGTEDMKGSSRYRTSSDDRSFVLDILLVKFLLIVIFVVQAYGRDFTVKRTLRGYAMSVTIKQNPPILGENDIKIEIKDSDGKYVTDASVMVNYFMPPMPGMPPMNYKVKASKVGSRYDATMDLIMEGPWNIAVRAKVADKRLRMTVLIDVR